MFKTRPFAVRSAASFDEHTDDGDDNLVDFRRRNHHAKVAGERFVAGGTTERDSEKNFVAEFYRFHADVVRVFHGSDQAAAVVSDVKLARQIVERAVVDDDLRERLQIRIHVNQLNRVHARRGIHREVADVVRTCAARVQPDSLDPTQKFRAILRLDEPHLKICPRGDLHITARKLLGDVCQFAKLMRRHRAARNPQPRHEGILHRCEKEQPVPFETKNVLLLRRLRPDIRTLRRRP